MHDTVMRDHLLETRNDKKGLFMNTFVLEKRKERICGTVYGCRIPAIFDPG